MSGLLVRDIDVPENYAIFLRHEDSDKANSQDPDDRDDHDEMIGVITTHKIDPFPELGYALHPSAWGKGYATEALQEYVKHYFDLKPQFDRLTAWVDTENAASVRLMRKTGFVEERIEYGDYVIPWMDPPKRNSILFVLKKPEILN
jgi:RimJ/RimL family protein N-acetyltransferase